MLTNRWLNTRLTLVPASISTYRPGGNFQNIPACVIELEITGFLHKLIEESRGYRTRPHGHQYRQNDR
ncbi:hypothetical protein TNCV_2592701 [Trichonephila clavipes]|nr:hypothetical protein TNCV_2592701 [Trichonephila clavipes]